jgi:hypothetical protein
VLDVSGDALTPVLADQLTDYLATRLAARGAYRVVPRRAVQAELLAAKARTLDACVDEACQIELGKALAAEQTLTARVIQLDDACALTAALFDLRDRDHRAGRLGAGPLRPPRPSWAGSTRWCTSSSSPLNNGRGLRTRILSLRRADSSFRSSPQKDCGSGALSSCARLASVSRRPPAAQRPSRGATLRRC